MNEIKFSHKYKKLKNPDGSIVEKVKLLDVWFVNLESISKQFINFDTDDGLFQLPEKGNYMALIFLKPSGSDLCITLRSFRPEKFKHYRSKIGEEFQIIFV